MKTLTSFALAALCVFLAARAAIAEPDYFSLQWMPSAIPGLEYATFCTPDPHSSQQTHYVTWRNVGPVPIQFHWKFAEHSVQWVSEHRIKNGNFVNDSSDQQRLPVPCQGQPTVIVEPTFTMMTVRMSPSVIDFEKDSLSSSPQKIQTLSLTNHSSDPVTIQARLRPAEGGPLTGFPFSLDPKFVTIGPYQTAKIAVTFAPTSSGCWSGSIRLEPSTTLMPHSVFVLIRGRTAVAGGGSPPCPH